MFLWSTGGIPACEGRAQRNLRILRWRVAYRGIRNGQHRAHRARRIGESCVRSVRGDIRAITADLLFGGARSDGTQLSRAGPGNPVPVGSLLHHRRTAEDYFGVHCAARECACVQAQDRDGGRAAEGVLCGGGLPPELCDAASRESLHLLQRRAQGCPAEEAVRAAVPRVCAVGSGEVMGGLATNGCAERESTY